MTASDRTAPSTDAPADRPHPAARPAGPSRRSTATYHADPQLRRRLRRRLAGDQATIAAELASRSSGIPVHLWLIFTGAVSLSERHRRSSEAAQRNSRALGGGARWFDAGTEPEATIRARLRAATFGLYRRDAKLSSAEGLWLWQAFALALPVGFVLGASVVLPEAVRLFLLILVALPFLAVSVLRFGVLMEALRAPRRDRPGAPASATEPLADDPARWPRYTILVPLYQEAQVIPGLVEAMDALDYPRQQIEIILVLEASDRETQKAAAEADLAPWFRVVVVPDGRPKTKPKALNYALAVATGDYVAIYDAEDLPHPGQLKAALAAFARHGETTGCVQAVLEIDTHQRGWIAAQFALEYRALFEGMLPALAKWRQPIPLGGTSNHFPRRVIEQVGGWDPFNVTEDADLGLRLHRAGYRVATIGSPTLEEAPPGPTIWLKQRTRWLKGYIQTYVVHMRQPLLLWRELGAAGFLGFQCLVGGQLLSALVHPWFYAMLLAGLLSGDLLAPSASLAERLLSVIAVVNLALGYLTAMLLALVVTGRRGLPLRPLLVLTMPLYWLMISAAAYRAVYQFARNPHYWEKTRHQARPRSR